VLSKLLGADHAARATPALTRVIDRARAVLRSASPNALDELELRSRPLAEQWEARGPGLMAGVRRLVGDDLLVPAAKVLPVQPIHGSGGVAHWQYNSVRIEAMLANPSAELPEVVRLGWLLAQLNLDLPIYQGPMHRERLRIVGPAALLPPIVTAAAEVELVAGGVPTVAQAIELWGLAPLDSAILWDWWETYLASPPTWPVALAALDRMLAP
jgi:hypothetical protein